jgi:hypothetical protein
MPCTGFAPALVRTAKRFGQGKDPGIPRAAMRAPGGFYADTWNNLNLAFSPF